MPPADLHVRNGLKLLLLLGLLLLEVLHQVLDVGADLPKVQIQVLHTHAQASGQSVGGPIGSSSSSSDWLTLA